MYYISFTHTPSALSSFFFFCSYGSPSQCSYLMSSIFLGDLAFASQWCLFVDANDRRLVFHLRSMLDSHSCLFFHIFQRGSRSNGVSTFVGLGACFFARWWSTGLCCYSLVLAFIGVRLKCWVLRHLVWEVLQF